jgi:hypothetical protein
MGCCSFLVPSYVKGGYKTNMYKTIIINWQGPYELKNRGNKPQQGSIFFQGGLYLITGIAKHKQKDKIQYCGIAHETEKHNSYFERFKRHPIIPKISRNLRVWLGKIGYPKSKARVYLEETERILIYFLQTENNIQKKSTPPESLTIINRWYKPHTADWSSEPRFNKPRILSDLDDVLSWDGIHWRSANKLSVYED